MENDMPFVPSQSASNRSVREQKLISTARSWKMIERVSLRMHESKDADAERFAIAKQFMQDHDMPSVEIQFAEAAWYLDKYFNAIDLIMDIKKGVDDEANKDA